MPGTHASQNSLSSICTQRQAVQIESVVHRPEAVFVY